MEAYDARITLADMGECLRHKGFQLTHRFQIVYKSRVAKLKTLDNGGFDLILGHDSQTKLGRSHYAIPEA